MRILIFIFSIVLAALIASPVWFGFAGLCIYLVAIIVWIVQVAIYDARRHEPPQPQDWRDAAAREVDAAHEALMASQPTAAHLRRAHHHFQPGKLPGQTPSPNQPAKQPPWSAASSTLPADSRPRNADTQNRPGSFRP
jgi:hypothetical protein